MNKTKSILLFGLVVFSLVLSACGGASTSPSLAPKVQAKEIVFTGVIEAMNGTEWIVSGQKVTVDPSAVLDPNITVGVIVKVEGQVSEDGTVTALKVETSTVTDDLGNDNSNDANGNDDNGNDDNSNTGNGNDGNSNGDNSNSANNNGSAAGGNESEIFGVVEAITTDSITVNGVTYLLANFTEFKDAIAVGDQVKLHIIVNSDGTFTIREVERSDGFGDDNGNDDNSNDDNGNDDNSNDDNGNGNSNDDNSNGGNGNDDNGNGGGNSGSGGGDDDNDNDDDNGNDD